jgi:hypothetical protein
VLNYIQESKEKTKENQDTERKNEHTAQHHPIYRPDGIPESQQRETAQCDPQEGQLVRETRQQEVNQQARK